MRIAHINNSSSLDAGNFAADLCRFAGKAGHETLLCHSHGTPPADLASYRIGDTPDALYSLSYRRSAAPRRLLNRFIRRFHRLSTNAGLLFHKCLSRLTDRSGFYSRHATRRLVRQLKQFSPNLIHLHQLGGDCIHLPTLFDYLQTSDIPVVWTLHDCWPFTGHCVSTRYPIQPFLSPEDAPSAHAPHQCQLWHKRCNHCPLRKSHPASYLMDQSARNFTEKRDLITSLRHLVLTTPTQWLAQQAAQSFLRRYPIHCLPHGVDVTRFAPCASERTMQDIALFYGLDELDGRFLVLSVADDWSHRQDLADLVDLARALGNDYCVVPVGLSDSLIDSLPYYMLGLPRPANVRDLCVLYTAADLCITLRQDGAADRTLTEAMACGTQVLCWDIPGTREALIPQSGETVPAGDIAAAADAVRRLCTAPKDPLFCIARAAQHGANLRHEGFLNLYDRMVQPSD